MKKSVILACIAIFSILCANADVVSSRTFGKKIKTKRTVETKTEWIVRAGVSCDNVVLAGSDFDENHTEYSWDECSGQCSYSTRAGFDVSGAFNRTLGNFGLYWGMELGFGTRGYKCTSEIIWKETGNIYNESYSQLHINAKCSPFTFGYKYAVTNNIKLDAHIGAFCSYDFLGYRGVNNSRWRESGWCRDSSGDYFDVGMQLGLGVWFEKFNLDLTWQRGFCPFIGLENYNDNKVSSSNFMIRVAYAF